jgi:hypothetical protein
MPVLENSFLPNSVTFDTGTSVITDVSFCYAA